MGRRMAHGPGEIPWTNRAGRSVMTSTTRSFAKASPVSTRADGKTVTVFGLLAAIIFLALSRSAIVPESVAYATPVVAFGLVLVLSLPTLNRLRIDRSALAPSFLGMLLIISTAQGGNTLDWMKAVGISAMWLVAYIASSSLPRDGRNFVVDALIVIGVIQVVVMVFESIVPVDFVRSYIASTSGSAYIQRPNLILGSWTNRAQGTLGYPITAGAYMAVCFGLACFRKNFDVRVRIAFGALFIFGALMSGTRVAIIAIVVAFLVGMWRRTRRFGRVMVVVGLIASLVAVSNFLSDAAESNDFSFVHRVGIIEGFGALLQRPLGIVFFGSGLNSHSSVFADGYLQESQTSAIDNAYLMTFVTMGLAAMILLIVVLCWAILTSRPEIAPAIGALAVMFTSFDALWWHFLAFVFWVLVGVGRPYESSARRRAPDRMIGRVGPVDTASDDFLYSRSALPSPLGHSNIRY